MQWSKTQERASMAPLCFHLNMSASHYEVPDFNHKHKLGMKRFCIPSRSIECVSKEQKNVLYKSFLKVVNVLKLVLVTFFVSEHGVISLFQIA